MPDIIWFVLAIEDVIDVVARMPGFIWFFLAIDVVATIVCVLKRRRFSALFGVGAIGSVIWANYDIANSEPTGASALVIGYGLAIAIVVFFLLSLLVTIGALRHATAKSWWATKQGAEDDPSESDS